MAPGVVSHVLASQGSAPLLARLAPAAADNIHPHPASWPTELHQASWYLNANDEEGQLAEVKQLAEDIRRLAACPVPCQAVQLLSNGKLLPSVWLQLAVAVAPLAATLTHLSQNLVSDPSAILSLCRALPQLHSLTEPKY
jgi:hypothetical protein